MITITLDVVAVACISFAAGLIVGEAIGRIALWWEERNTR